MKRYIKSDSTFTPSKIKGGIPFKAIDGIRWKAVDQYQDGDTTVTEFTWDGNGYHVDATHTYSLADGSWYYAKISHEDVRHTWERSGPQADWLVEDIKKSMTVRSH